MDHDLPAIRRRLAELLPAAMARAMASYRAFALAERAEPRGDQAFAKHHSACRAALGHLDALFRLARWTGAVDAAATPSAAADEADLERMVEAARKALASYPNHPEDDP